MPRLSCHGGCSLTENSGSAPPAPPGAAGFRQDGLQAAVTQRVLLILHSREPLWGCAVLAGSSVRVAGSRLDASRSQRDFLPFCYLCLLQLTAMGTERGKGGRWAENASPVPLRRDGRRLCLSVTRDGCSPFQTRFPLRLASADPGVALWPSLVSPAAALRHRWWVQRLTGALTAHAPHPPSSPFPRRSFPVCCRLESRSLSASCRAVQRKQ